MSTTQPQYNKEEIAQRGDEIYESDIRPGLSGDDEGKYVAIDIQTGAFEIDRDELAASDHLRSRQPDAVVWLVRVGSRCVRRYGPRNRSESIGND